MSKTGDLWLEEYETAIERFVSRQDIRVIFIANLLRLGCSEIEIGDLICELGMVGQR